MRRIFKYRLPPVGYAGLAMHEPVRFLGVGWQGRQLVLWAEVRTETPPTIHHIHVVLTGGDPPHAADYIGSAQNVEDGEPYVVHVYRENPSAETKR